MKEILYEPVMRLISEQRPGWKFTFENEILKVRTDGTMVDHEILQQIQNLGFRIDEILYLEEWGIIFSILEEGLT